jgi:predicted permease
MTAWWGVKLFLTLAPPGIPRMDEVGVDWRVLLFALGLTALTALLIGGASALHTAKVNLAPRLRATRGSGSRARGSLVAVGTAIAVMLLAGATLLGRTFADLTAWDPGFPREDLLVAWTSVPSGSYPTASAVRQVYGEALGEVRALPGVRSASLTSAGPLFGGTETGTAWEASRGTDSSVVRWYNIAPDYFATLGVPILAGREFTPADRGGNEPVAIINETLARRLWPGRSPVGERIVIEVTEREAIMTVVGMVADVRPFQPDLPVRPAVYWPFFQLSRWGAYIVVRSDGTLPGLPAAVRNRLRLVSAELEPSRVSTLDDFAGRQLVSPRFNALLLGSFAVVALLLAAVGISGLIAYRVSHREREIGIRMALGATTGEVVGQFVREGLVLVGIGVAAGAVGAVGLTRVLGAMLAGTSPTDPLSYVAVITGMLAIGVCSAWVPARRASRVDPLEALRAE